MDASERELFAGSVRAAMERGAPSVLGDALSALGWTDALRADPRTAVSTVFELQGRANVASPALDDVMVSVLGADHAGGVVLPALGVWTAPGHVGADRLAVTGLAFAVRVSDAATMVVANDASVHRVPTAGLEVRPVGGLDPALGLVEVTGDVAPVQAGTADWPAAVAAGRLALGHELAGAARAMLDLAREHALQRIQFGRPIAVFQAVRHRLAETLVAIEGAEAVLAAAWEDRSAPSAAIAKAVSGRAARTAARHCQQVLAGIGFTTEHPFHGYVRRVIVLDQLLGSARALTAELGRGVLADRTLPPLLPL